MCPCACVPVSVCSSRVKVCARFQITCYRSPICLVAAAAAAAAAVVVVVVVVVAVVVVVVVVVAVAVMNMVLSVHRNHKAY